MTAAEIMERWAEVDVHSLQKQDELAALVEFLLPRPAPKTVLEIGTFQGATLRVWCELAAEDALIVSVDMPTDPWKGVDSFSAADEPRLRSYAKPGQEVVFIRTDSHDPRTRLEVKAAFRGRWVDLLFIDGDHSYDGVRQDFEDYGPLVDSGGVVIFHDILDRPGEPFGVNALWQQIKDRAETTAEFVDGSGEWGGLGLVVLA